MTPRIRNSLLISCGVIIVFPFLMIRPRDNVTRSSLGNLQDLQIEESTDKFAAANLEVEQKKVQVFKEWMNAYFEGNREADFIEKGLELAKARRESMLVLIKIDAETALKEAVGFAEYDSLPQRVQALIEKPFTFRGNVEVLATCDSKSTESEYEVFVYKEDGERSRIGKQDQWRTGLSKLDVPLQGIELDHWMAVEPRAFMEVRGANAEWALAKLPSGNSNRSTDFLTGQPLKDDVVTAVAGGLVFQFSNQESLMQVEELAMSFDRMAGKNTGSSALFPEEGIVQAKALPVDSITERQQQLLIEDTTGSKKTLFIHVDFPNHTGDPDYKEYFTDLVNNQVSKYLSEYSYGQTSMSATVGEHIYRMSKADSEYISTGEDDTIDNQDLFDEAVAAYRADVVDRDPFLDYDIVGIIFPKIGGLDWSGRATVGTANSKMWLNGAVKGDTILHEYGHNYGLLHANFWNNTSTNNDSINPVDPSGASVEYGDNSDIMGRGDIEAGHFHMAAKRFLGWLKPEQIQSFVQTGANGVFRVYQFDDKDAPDNHIQGIQIRKTTNEYYWVGLRKHRVPHTFFNPYILWERAEGAARNQTWLISPYPQQLWGDTQGFSPFGKTYSDNVANVRITPITLGGSAPEYYLDVGVFLGDTTGNTPPTLSLNIPKSGNARQPIRFEAIGNDTDGDELAYIWALGDSNFHPNAAVLNTEMIAGGTYGISVTVSDLKGGFKTEAAQITIEDPLTNWRTRESNTESDLLALAQNDEFLVAAGEGVLLRSDNGRDWIGQNVSGIADVTIYDMCWTGSRFIAVGNGKKEYGFGGFKAQHPVIYTSLDGNVWTREFELPPAGTSSNRFLSVSSNTDGSLVMAVGDKGQIYRSENSGSWTKVEMGISEFTEIRGIAYGEGVFLMGGLNSNPSGIFLYRTINGQNWIDLSDFEDYEFPNFGDLSFENGRFYSFGKDQWDTTYYSEDNGNSWQRITGRSGEETYAAAYGNEVYCAAIRRPGGSSNSLAVALSTDGKYWQNIGLEGNYHAHDIQFYKNTFVMVGIDGQIWQSVKLLDGYAGWVDTYLEGDQATASANPDGDWADNLWEWAMGTRPNDFKSAPPQPEMLLDETGRIVFRLARILNPEQVSVSVEKSINLNDWEVLSINGLVDDGSHLKITSSEPLSAYPCFLRLKLIAL